MKDPFLLFWAVLILASILWYGFLVVYLGIKAGREIHALTRALDAGSAKRREPSPQPHEP
jgi:hypothetical protein